MQQIRNGLIVIVLVLVGCAPEVGSQRWCEKMQTKPKGNWTLNEAADFAKHCILRSDD
jgi:hypothetical protein